MKLSVNWLSQWTEHDGNIPALCDALTMAGLEVDGVETVGEGLTNVVVGQVESREQHPDADKLSVCQVFDGETTQTVVCGAPNVAAGQFVAYARPGAALPNGMKLKVAKLRGVESHGMLCSAAELGLGDSADGIMVLPQDAPVGTSLIDYLKLNDEIIDVDLTPNRGDCLSVLGIAREVALLRGQSKPEPSVPAVPPAIEDRFPVSLEAPASCPKYAGRVIKGVNAAAPTPIWLSEALRRAGVRSISPVVDITNYVMLELGQPMHAFDLATLAGGITVRLARDGEKLILLDGAEVDLTPQTLVIADHDKPVALAGIMGGEATGVQSHSADILLESAFFEPIKLAGVARQFRLHTDASHRFERGVDYLGQERAIERATALIVDICGGQPGPIEVAQAQRDMPAREPVAFAPELIEKVLGIKVPLEHVSAMFEGLGCEVESGSSVWQVTPPAYRFDLAIAVDLIEEVARLHGYDKLGATMPSAEMTLSGQDKWRSALADCRNRLVSNGYFEAITYSFIDESLFGKFNPELDAYRLENPISAEMSVMRASLLPGLVEALKYNQNRQQQDIRLFEIGRVFRLEDAGLIQPHRIAGVMSGRRLPEHWSAESNKADFFDIKQIVEELISSIGLYNAEMRKSTNPSFHPGQSVSFSAAGEIIGDAGSMHPQLVQRLGLRSAPLMFELSVPRDLSAKTPSFVPFSKFPAVRRDISIVIEEQIDAAQVTTICSEAGGELLRDLQLFDVFRGQGIDSDKKSLALGLIFQASSRTLTEDEIETSVQRVLKRLAKDLGATLRE
ncbi:MAG: phenylalanine--tRNA ligase subunit beta [Gammaproteobacteria bacterium]